MRLLFRSWRTAVASAVAIAVLLALAIALWPTHKTPRADLRPRTPPVRPPTGDAPFDYQIGGAYPLPSGTRVVSRDRSAEPAAGAYNICYVNAFQAQQDELSWWRSTHPDLLLRGADGAPIVDRDWNEALLDVSTPAKRTAIAGIVGGWIDGCARRGFQAVEPDNLDSDERSHGRLSQSDNAAFAHLLALRAHAAGLAIAQKNDTDLLPRHRDIGFDFAIAEECGHYRECGRYVSAYGNRVFDIEYDTRDFTAACREWGARLSIVLRDLDVTAPGHRSYRFRAC